MSEPLFDENTFLGVTVNPRLFWIVFTLLLVFFTSPVAHLPYFFGFQELTCILAGLLAVVFNVLIPLWVARVPDKEGEETVIDFPGGKNEKH